MYRWLLGALALLGASACLSQQKFPGSEVVGTFSFDATAVSSDCHYVEEPDGGFSYVGTLSYDPDGGAFFTIGDVDRDAGFDGQVFTSWASANRLFTECNCGQNVQVKERISVAVLSKSQSDAVKGSCPANPLDGGVPAPGGGITGPAPTANGYDAQLACGEQEDDIVPLPDAGCSCKPCTLVYSVSGVRQ